MEQVSIVVPTFRRAETLRRTLGSLTAIDYPTSSYEIVVVDDGGTSDTEQVVRAWGDDAVEVTYIPQQNRGAGAARNLGADRAEGTLLLFCDDDILVDRDHLSRHIATRERHGDPLVNGVRWYAPETLAELEVTSFGRYRLELERGFDAARDGRKLDDTTVETGALYSCNLAIRKDLFEDLRGFDERFPYAGSEDQDFALRARAAGCTLVRDHAIQLLHIDPAVSLRQFCARQETGAQGVVMLAQKYPEVAQAAMMRENGPVRRKDGPSVIGKKLAKSVLSVRPVLASMHGVVQTLERIGLGDPALARLYHSMIGLYIYRGIRSAL